MTIFCAMDYNRPCAVVAVAVAHHSSTTGVGAVASAAQSKWVISGFWGNYYRAELLLQGA
jgi:hypothetical protein